MKVLPSDIPLIHITALIHHHYFYTNEKKVHHNTFKHRHMALSGSSDVKPQKLWLLQVCVRHISLKRESLHETLSS